jgi:hypothetical protein
VDVTYRFLRRSGADPDGGRPVTVQARLGDQRPKAEIVQKGGIEYAGLMERWGGRYWWQVPAEAAGDYRVRVQMDGGPFQLDAANESVIHVSGP